MMSKKYTTFEEWLFKILTFQKNTVSGLLLFYIKLNLLILVKYIMDTIFSGLKKKKKKNRPAYYEPTSERLWSTST